MSQIAIPLVVITLIIVAIVGALYAMFGLPVALLIAFVVCGIFMGLVILIQRPKGGGLSGAFGGAGGDQGAVFGSKVGDVLTLVTGVAFVIFAGLGVWLTYAIRADLRGSEPTQEVTPASTTTSGGSSAPSTGTAGTGSNETNGGSDTDAEAAANENLDDASSVTPDDAPIIDPSAIEGSVDDALNGVVDDVADEAGAALNDLGDAGEAVGDAVNDTVNDAVEAIQDAATDGVEEAESLIPDAVPTPNGAG